MNSFFDADIGVGESGRRLACFETAERMGPWMDRYRITRALVYDRGAVESGQFRDFSRILDFGRGQPDRLFPTIPIAPPASGESPEPEDLVAQIRAEGICGVRVWPELHALDFDSFHFDRILAPLEAHRVPVLVHLSEGHPWGYRSGWKNLAETARAFPELPLIILWSGVRNGRQMLPLLDGCPNVRFDLTCVTGQFLEFFGERWGAGRLVIASHYPQWDPGIGQAWVNFSGLSRADQARVAEGNLSDLVEGIR